MHPVHLSYTTCNESSKGTGQRAARKQKCETCLRFTSLVPPRKERKLETLDISSDRILHGHQVKASWKDAALKNSCDYISKDKGYKMIIVPKKKRVARIPP